MFDKTNKKVLYLTLKKPQFKVTISGEKNSEFRRPSKWILARILGKDYDLVKFTNGYGSDKPYFICEFNYWRHAEPNTHHYSNGLIVEVNSTYIEIVLGRVLEVGNYEV